MHLVNVSHNERILITEAKIKLLKSDKSIKSISDNKLIIYLLGGYVGTRK